MPPLPTPPRLPEVRFTIDDEADDADDDDADGHAELRHATSHTVDPTSPSHAYHSVATRDASTPQPPPPPPPRGATSTAGAAAARHANDRHDYYAAAQPSERQALVANADGGDQEEDEDDGDERSSRHHKYPPTAPPPTYSEAVGGGSSSGSPGSSLRSRLRRALAPPAWLDEVTLPALPDPSRLRRGLSRAWSLTARCWPTSRFAQASLFLVGLWLLIVLSGGQAAVSMGAGDAAGDGEEGKGGWSVAQDDLSDPSKLHGPQPLSGDGVVDSYARWTLDSCVSRGWLLSVQCRSSASFELDPPKSFSGTAKLFFHADPERSASDMTAGRGRVRGEVRVRVARDAREADEMRGRARVKVVARYPMEAAQLLRGMTVVKLKGGLADQGVGIYTLPTPARFRRPRSPVEVSVEMVLPPKQPLPALVIDTSAMDVELFPPDSPSPHGQRRGVGGGQGSGAAGQARAAEEADAFRQPPLFGRLEVKTSTGEIRSSDSLRVEAMGHVLLRSTARDVVVRGGWTSMTTELESVNGAVRLGEGARVTGWHQASVTTRLGAVEVGRDAVVEGNSVKAFVERGSVVGAGRWSTNGTLQLESVRGGVRANVALRRPSLPAPAGSVAVLTVYARATGGEEGRPSQGKGGAARRRRRQRRRRGPGDEERDYAALGERGDVRVTVVEHDGGTSLHLDASSERGSARATLSAARFEGEWEVEGARGEARFEPPGPPPTTLGWSAGERKWEETGSEDKPAASAVGGGAGEKTAKAGWTSLSEAHKGGGRATVHARKTALIDFRW